MVGIRLLGVAALSTVVAGACVLDRNGQKPLAGSGGGSEVGGMGGTLSVGGMSGQGGAGGGIDPAPGPVENLTAVVNGDVTVTWDNPTDIDVVSVLVVQREGQPVSFSPNNDTVYDVGAEVLTNQFAIVSELTESFTLPQPAVPGRAYHFAAWALDAGGNYSARRVTSDVDNALGTQHATVEVSINGGVVVTVTQQPPNFVLSGTATYAAGPNRLDVTLTASNNTSRVVFNLKGLLTNTNQGTIDAGRTFPVAVGDPVTYFGPEGLDVGSDHAGTALTIGGVDATVDPITFDVDLVDAPWLIAQVDESTKSTDARLFLADSSGSGHQTTITPTDHSSTVRYRDIAVTPDGRRAFLGAKAQPLVTAIDLVTLTSVLGADLTTSGIGAIGGVAMHPDGEHVLASLTDGAHSLNATIGDQLKTVATTTDVALVEIDTTTLVETRRLVLAQADVTVPLARLVKVSADGTVAAVIMSHPLPLAINAAVYIIDLVNWVVIDADAATGTLDPVVLPNEIRPDALVVNDDGSIIYVGNRDNSDVHAVDTATFAVATLTPAAMLERVSGLMLRNGNLYVTRNNVLNSPVGTAASFFDTMTSSEGALDPMFAQSHGIVGGHDRYFVLGANQIAVFDDSNVRLDTDGDGNNGVTNILLGGNIDITNHVHALTPF